MNKNSHKTTFSKETGAIMGEIIREILTRLELELSADREGMEASPLFRLFFLEKKGRPLGEITLVLRYVQQKIPISDFAFAQAAITRKNPNLSWSVLHSHLSKLIEEIAPTSETVSLQKDSPVIHFSSEGEFYRRLGDKKYSTNFREERKKTKLFLMLQTVGKYVQTNEIVLEIEFPSAEAARKSIGEFNKKLRIGLGLKIGEKIIQGKSGSGYRLNRNYSFVRI